MPGTQRRRNRGRPVGGGITAAQSKEAFLDAAERLFATLGYRASSMEVIAREAGYSRGSIYRQFPSRESLVQALVQRTTQRHTARILERLPADIGPVSLIVEAMVVVATELIHDPLLRNLSEQTDERTVAFMLANDAGLAQMVEAMIEAFPKGDDTEQFRADVRPKDLAQFIIATNLSMLLGVIPGIDDAETARRYIEVFVLPALVAHPPPPRAVFSD